MKGKKLFEAKEKSDMFMRQVLKKWLRDVACRI